MPINILSQTTINKIAAGEVVERPLNVVKELVENSLDAFASSVVVEIESAGKKLIRVSDNGFGMDKKDLNLSILRHATSKIENFDDLAHIHSLGFRGEALASIVAVSGFEMKTRQKGDASGWKLSVEGGCDIKIVPWSGTERTIPEVKKLIFNTPSRQKFLQSDSTERSKIISSLEETALANNDVTFKLISEGKVIFSTMQTDNKVNRIADVLGKDFADKIMFVKIIHPKASFDVYFTGRSNFFTSKKYQYFFVNSRPVNYPKWLTHCIHKAYEESVPYDKKYPGVLIYVTIDSSEIDVNIHPTKREVKFAGENGMYDIIYKTVKNAISSHPISEIKINHSPLLESKNLMNQDEKKTVTYSTSQLPQNPISVEEQVCIEDSKYVFPKQTRKLSAYVNVFEKQQDFAIEKFEDNVKIIGQAFDTYIIVENKNDVYIFDQHAAAERLRYEIYLREMRNQSIKTQQMLMPENFDIVSSGAELLKANIDLFNELGISIEEFGQNSFRITAYPALLGNISMEQIVKTIISDIEDCKYVEIEQKKDRIIRSACRTSVKAGDKLSFLEAKKLVIDLFKCSCPFTCPHGRPTAYKISLNELDKFFKRK
ncbi:MAG: DNA mismatch repair endonuclease MutL [Endomicrobium sp.]|jgi:DNA mismatch repair protein MutL|nr:DNA mismatch repair endonuclease MutL [Endomicrobium sp.]